MQEHANQSAIMHKHSAVILSNGTPKAYGINTIRGARPFHAEANAIRSYLINRGLLGWVKEKGILWNLQPTKGR